MSAISCGEVLVHLESYRRGDGSRELAALVEEHLARCPRCRRNLAHMKRVTAMVSAWRPVRVPRSLKVEIAEAAGESVGRAAREAFARRAMRPGRRIRRELPRLHRVANLLAAAGLVFLAVALVWRLALVPSGGDSGGGGRAGPAAREEFAVFLVDREDSDGAAPGEDLVREVRDVTGLPRQEAEALVDRLPARLAGGLEREEAEALRRRFEALGAAVEVRPAGARRGDGEGSSGAGDAEFRVPPAR